MHGVFTDIDDTLTTFGAITPDALAALAELQAAGIPVIALTGRPQGWCASIASHWPLTAAVAENGAVAMWREAKGLQIEYAQDSQERARNAKRLTATAQRILREVPGAQLARDSAGRVTDIAIDHAEFTHFPGEQIGQVVDIMRSEGLTATVSSIHINGWIGSHSKASGARWMVQRHWGRALDAELTQWLFVGDSSNDQAMFALIPLSVGVDNVREHQGLQRWPRYVTRGARGAGFAEVAQALLRSRSSVGGL